MTGRLYTVYPEFDEEDCLEWIVFEFATQQVIDTCLFEEDAVELVEFMEKGGAFHGFTPSFMLTRIPKMDINSAFAAEFA